MGWLPIVEWLPRYQRAWLPADLISGATVWAVLIPSALAYVGIVGVEPIVGLYTVPIALVAYALLGGSLIHAPTPIARPRIGPTSNSHASAFSLASYGSF